MNEVNLTYHLYAAVNGSQSLTAFDNVRTPLARRIAAGTETSIDLRVDAPAEPGDYVLEVDLVHEGVTWFAERGGKTATIALRVT